MGITPTEYALIRTPHMFAGWCSRRAWEPAPFLSHIGNAIANAVNASCGRVIVNLPPRYGKSELVSFWTPAWFLKRAPDKHVMLACHDDTLSGHYGRRVRNECVDNPLINLPLAPDSQARDLWHTPQGGGMMTGSVESGFTGFGGDLIVVDDPYPNWAAAQSATYRRKVNEWYDGTLYNRLNAGGSLVVLNHRMHPDDLTGYLLKNHPQERWVHIRLPEIAEANDPIGRAPGEVLCPDRFPPEIVERRRMGTVAEKWAALHQQDPQVGGAGNVYSHFGQANLDHAAELVPGLPLCVAFDFNINPGMHAIIGQYDHMTDRGVVVDELHGPRMTLIQCLEALVRWWQTSGGFRWPEIQVFGDASGGAGSIQSGDSMYDVISSRLRMTGVNYRIRVPSRSPSIVDSVMTVNDALLDVAGVPHWRVHPRCVRLLTDLREQRADEYGKVEKADQKLGHAGDALRYWVHYVRPVGGAVEMPRGRFIMAE